MSNKNDDFLEYSLKLTIETSKVNNLTNFYDNYLLPLTERRASTNHPNIFNYTILSLFTNLKTYQSSIISGSDSVLVTVHLRWNLSTSGDRHRLAPIGTDPLTPYSDRIIAIIMSRSYAQFLSFFIFLQDF
ncbi:hypothetical protein QFZ31_004549 [Neobacillus niacini]|nr:hypothetical protein [Neobacillus niacini]